MTFDREYPCRDCPFKEMKTRREVLQLVEPGTSRQPRMLCHESSCLSGIGRSDYLCAGYYQARRRLNIA